MEALLEQCFFALQVDPGGADVFLTEAHQPPRANRETTVETMFELFDVGATYLHVQPVLALFAHGKTSGCVVDSGEYSTSIFPVADGYQLESASVKLPYGMYVCVMYLIVFVFAYIIMMLVYIFAYKHYLTIFMCVNMFVYVCVYKHI